MSVAPPGWRPEREIQFVAGTPAGGGQDRPARALVRILESRGFVGRPIRLVNMPGRGGGNAWDYLRRHARDPHVVAVGSPTLLTNKLLRVADFDHADLTPLAMLCTEYIVFIVRADSAIRTGADFMARIARDATGCTVAIATALGNTNHMALARITQLAGGDVGALDIRVFDSALDAVADVVGRGAEVAAVTAVSAVDAMTSGHVRAIAVTSPARLPRIHANVPAWAESGVDCVTGTWRGVIGAAGIAPEQIAFWVGALRDAVATAEWRAVLEHQYWAATYREGADLGVFLDRDRAAMRDALRALGLMS